MLELAQTVLKLTGSNSKMVYLPLPTDDPRQRMPDIDRARKLLKWEPETPLETGLSKTIAYFKERMT